MRRKKQNVKRTIKKKIELNNKQLSNKLKNKNKKDVGLPKPKEQKAPNGKINRELLKYQKMKKGSFSDERMKRRLDNSQRSRKVRKNQVSVDLTNQVNKSINEKKITYREYKKKIYVDFDVIICIPSFNRYEKVVRLLKQFYEQDTKYTFKIILLNDGSDDVNYNKIPEQFNNIIYLKNKESNGKINHWYCYNQMWEYVKKYESHAVLQMDDDFILCDSFLDIIIDYFFENKKENDKMRAIGPHLWSFNKNSDKEIWWSKNNFVDGVALIDSVVLEEINYKLESVNIEKVKKLGVPVGVWNQISNAITNNDGYIIRTKESLVYHDDLNGDSVLHKKFRKKYNKIIYTRKFKGSSKFLINE